jgi:hypothetical protein
MLILVADQIIWRLKGANGSPFSTSGCGVEFTAQSELAMVRKFLLIVVMGQIHYIIRVILRSGVPGIAKRPSIQDSLMLSETPTIMCS